MTTIGFFKRTTIFTFYKQNLLITLPALDEGRVGRGLAAGVAGSGAGMEAFWPEAARQATTRKFPRRESKRDSMLERETS